MYNADKIIKDFVKSTGKSKFEITGVYAQAEKLALEMHGMNDDDVMTKKEYEFVVNTMKTMVEKDDSSKSDEYDKLFEEFITSDESFEEFYSNYSTKTNKEV